MPQGLLVTFEGIDGSGKTTQCEMLVDRLRNEEGRGVVAVREPGGTVIGEKLRDIIKHGDAGAETELFLLAASRAELVRKVISPAILEGLTVISDRFADSTVAYQGYGRGGNLGDVQRIAELSTCGVVPSLTFLIDVDPLVAQRRIGERERGGRDNFDRQGLSFSQSVRDGYLKIAKQHPRRFLVVDGSGDAETVGGRVFALWQAFLGRGVRGQIEMPKCIIREHDNSREMG